MSGKAMKLLKIAAAGMIAGALLGFFLKWCEHITGKAVYTLLLNIDYLPLLSDWKLNELGEFFLHLIVSAAVAPALYLLFSTWGWEKKASAYVLGSTVIGLVYYPFTMLSERTPALLDAASILLWLLGHILFGSILAVLLIYGEGNRHREKKHR
ncbi:hypothetical protein [Virgibacillus sediminis]|uniref:DUF1440 domain-containing protein n=1 Tax=Virgibacillus sediminis TaxID=202260 RepID=A0ABV7A7V5_9BACI